MYTKDICNLLVEDICNIYHWWRQPTLQVWAAATFWSWKPSFCQKKIFIPWADFVAFSGWEPSFAKRKCIFLQHISRLEGRGESPQEMKLKLIIMEEEKWGRKGRMAKKLESQICRYIPLPRLYSPRRGWNLQNIPGHIGLLKLPRDV